MRPEASQQNRHEHFRVPVHIFPDDERVSSADYRAVMDSGYVSSVSTLSGAVESFGVNCDEETIERWRRIGASAGLLDDFLDDSPNRELALGLYIRGVSGDGTVASEMPEWGDPRLPAALLLLKNSTSTLPHDQVGRMRHSALAIGELSRAKALCDDASAYIDLLRAEAWHTAALVHESTSAAMQNTPGFDHFVVWVHRALELGTLYDSSRDIKADATENRTAITPSVINCMRIALSARSPLFLLLRDQKHRRAARASLWSRIKHQNL